MKRSEDLARVLVIVLCLGVILIPLATRLGNRAIDIHAKMAESGGWTPNSIKAEVGQPIHLRLTSDDVVHSFSVGQLGMEAVDIIPGKVTDLTLQFNQPGTYTFYCTRWCGLNHWRMRGTIEVSGASDSTKPVSPPLYVSLGLDIDAPHPTSITPSAKPSAVRGGQLVKDLLPLNYMDSGYYRSHAPAQAYLDLRSEPALRSLTDAQIWDLVAYLWQSQVTPEGLAEGKKLYAQNCAACHGENGAGDGVFADKIKSARIASAMATSGADMTRKKPVDFTDAAQLLGARPALLQGKLLRGGMGTGMPMWGAIFTEEQTWNIVEYLYNFQFEEVFP